MNDQANQAYSWGMGSSYILGNRDEENEYHAYTVNPKMYEENPVFYIGCGSQHVVVLTTENQQTRELPTFDESVINFQF